MRTVISFSGSDCVLIILFQLNGIKAWNFEGNSFSVAQYDCFLTFILEQELIRY